MKIIGLFVLAFTLLVGVVQAQTNLLYGSPEAVERHSLKEGRIFDITIFQTQDVGVVEVGTKGWNTNFTAKTSMDNHFRLEFAGLARKALSVDLGQDRDRPFRMIAMYYRRVSGTGVPSRSVYYYVADVTFSFIKDGGTYYLPDLTAVEMELPSDYVVYSMSKFAWAQVDTVSSNGYRVRTVDSENPQEGFDLPRSLILIPTQHAVSDSFKTTVRVVTSQNAFKVFENGSLRPEKPAEVGIGIQELAASGKAFIPPSLTLHIKNGEPGRIYQIQSSPDLGGAWTDLPSGKVINLPAYENLISTTVDGVQQFYRAVPVDGVPIPK